MQTVLNIANNYFGTDVFRNISTAQRELGYKSKTVVFLRNSVTQYTYDKNEILLVREASFFNILFRALPFLRFYYHKKKIENFIEGDEIRSVHSHTLHSNGSLGSKIACHLKIPHVSSIRNTDVNLAIPKFIHLRRFYKKTLFNSVFVTCPNSAYKNYIYKTFGITCTLLQNPIDPYWCSETARLVSDDRRDELRVCVVGEIRQNKNQLSVLSALATLGIRCRLQLIGDVFDPIYFNKIIGGQGNVRVEHIGHLDSKESVKKVLIENQVMCMPSIYETFGLALIESAMSGVPVVFTKGQAIDGYLEDGLIGFKVNPNDIFSIADGILKAKELDPKTVKNIAKEKFNSVSYQITLGKLYA